MKNRLNQIIIVIFLIAISISANAQNVAEMFKKANKAYEAAQYDSAAIMYEQIVQTNNVAPALYYNLGNSYYRQNKIAKAILNYERALLLAPNDEEIIHNLEKANLKVSQKVEAINPFFLNVWMQQIRDLFSVNTWTTFSLVFFGAFLLFLSLFIFSAKIRLRKPALYLSFLMILLFLVSFSFGIYHKKTIVNHRNAIVMAETVTAQSTPNEHGTELFTLHEGLKVKIKDVRENWVEIQLLDGKIGWLPVSTIELI